MFIPSLGSIVSFEDGSPSDRTFNVVAKYATTSRQTKTPTCLLVSPSAMGAFYKWISDGEFDGIVSLSNSIRLFADTMKSSDSVILWEPDFDEPLVSVCNDKGKPLMIETNEGTGCFKGLEEQFTLGSIVNLKEKDSVPDKWSDKERSVRVNYTVDAQFLIDPHDIEDPRINLLLGSHFHNRTKPITYWLNTLDAQHGGNQTEKRGRKPYREQNGCTSKPMELAP